MVSSAIWKKNMHEWNFQTSFFESEGRVQFEVFEKLTFFKLHEKPYYYMKKLCSHVRKSHLEIKKLRKLRDLKNKKLRKFKILRNCHCISFFALCTVFHHCHCISKKLHCSSQSELRNFFMYIISTAYSVCLSQSVSTLVH
jgi:hypothetical protein